MVVLAYPSPEELEGLMDRAFDAHEEIHRIVSGIVRLFNPTGPAMITGPLQMKLHIDPGSGRRLRATKGGAVPHSCTK